MVKLNHHQQQQQQQQQEQQQQQQQHYLPRLYHIIITGVQLEDSAQTPMVVELADGTASLKDVTTQS